MITLFKYIAVSLKSNLDLSGFLWVISYVQRLFVLTYLIIFYKVRCSCILYADKIYFRTRMHFNLFLQLIFKHGNGKNIFFPFSLHNFFLYMKFLNFFFSSSYTFVIRYIFKANIKNVNLSLNALLI